MAKVTAVDPYSRPVPPRALAFSGAALVVAVAGALFFKDAVAEYGFLVWLLAIIPAFLLCHYRGWHRITAVLGSAMALLSLGYVVSVLAGWQLLEWPVFVFIVATYVGLALGWGWFGEVRQVAEVQQETQQELRLTHAHLRKSYADLQLAQWKLIEAEKLEAVGQLAAGVAHEVKNPLMTMLTGTRYLAEYVKFEDENVRVLLDDMLEAVDRADSVITGLLDFSAPRDLDPRPTNLNELVERSAKMVKHELNKAHVSIHLDLARRLPLLPLDGFKIQQVLVNVFTNAAHATPNGGHIFARTYRTDSVVLGAQSEAGGVLESGRDMVVLEVDDTGIGIAPEQLSKLYDPFFTTKPTGEGTGLGLAVTRQIVDMHGGKIDIRNRDEGGARVTVVFNVAEEATDGGQEAYSVG